MHTDSGPLAEIRVLRTRLQELEKMVAVHGLVDDALPPSGDVTVLISQVGEHRVAFRQDQLDEVIPMVNLTAIPESPTWVLGLLNLRGELLPVIDLHDRLTLHAGRNSSKDLLIIARVDDRRIGLLVESVTKIVPASVDSLEAPPSPLPSAPYVHGVLKLDDDPVLLVSIPRIYTASGVEGLVS